MAIQQQKIQIKGSDAKLQFVCVIQVGQREDRCIDSEMENFCLAQALCLGKQYHWFCHDIWSQPQNHE